MRIGVVCEGPTDYPAIKCFFGHALNERGIAAQFIPLFPELDRTRPEGGWGNVLLWLANHPPAFRITTYFGGGLFGGNLATTPLDVILVHLDADIIEDKAFRLFVKDRYTKNVSAKERPLDRANAIREVIRAAANFDEMANLDRAKHVIAVATEATETWCVAAFQSRGKGYELLRGDALRDKFMTVLERSEGREPRDAYAQLDKSARRRKRFCNTHAGGSGRIVKGCRQFRDAFSELTSLA